MFRNLNSTSETTVDHDFTCIETIIKAAALVGPTTENVFTTIRCHNGHSMEICFRKVRSHSVKMQFHCDSCGLGGEGWYPAGAWSTKK